MNINEYNNLLNKYIKLLFEKNKLIMRDAPYTESKFLFHFGDLMIEELRHNKNIKELRIKQNIYATFQTFRYTLCSNLYFSKYLNYFQGLCRYAFYHSIFVLYLKAIFSNSDCCPLFTYI